MSSIVAAAAATMDDNCSSVHSRPGADSPVSSSATALEPCAEEVPGSEPHVGATAQCAERVAAQTEDAPATASAHNESASVGTVEGEGVHDLLAASSFTPGLTRPSSSGLSVIHGWDASTPPASAKHGSRSATARANFVLPLTTRLSFTANGSAATALSAATAAAGGGDGGSEPAHDSLSRTARRSVGVLGSSSPPRSASHLAHSASRDTARGNSSRSQLAGPARSPRPSRGLGASPRASSTSAVGLLAGAPLAQLLQDDTESNLGAGVVGRNVLSRAASPNTAPHERGDGMLLSQPSPTSLWSHASPWNASMTPLPSMLDVNAVRPPPLETRRGAHDATPASPSAVPAVATGLQPPSDSPAQATKRHIMRAAVTQLELPAPLPATLDAQTRARCTAFLFGTAVPKAAASNAVAATSNLHRSDLLGKDGEPTVPIPPAAHAPRRPSGAASRVQLELPSQHTTAGQEARLEASCNTPEASTSAYMTPAVRSTWPLSFALPSCAAVLRATDIGVSMGAASPHTISVTHLPARALRHVLPADFTRLTHLKALSVVDNELGAGAWLDSCVPVAQPAVQAATAQACAQQAASASPHAFTWLIMAAPEPALRMPGGAVLALGMLPALQQLDLTCNAVHHLPQLPDAFFPPAVRYVHLSIPIRLQIELPGVSTDRRASDDATAIGGRTATARALELLLAAYHAPIPPSAPPAAAHRPAQRHNDTTTQHEQAMRTLTARLETNYTLGGQPTPVSLFPNLVKLDVSFNTLAAHSLATLCLLLAPTLESLTVSHCGLPHLPLALSRCLALQTFDASHNHLRDAEAWVILSRLPRLQTLCLDHNEFATIPSYVLGVIDLVDPWLCSAGHAFQPHGATEPTGGVTSSPAGDAAYMAGIGSLSTWYPSSRDDKPHTPGMSVGTVTLPSFHACSLEFVAQQLALPLSAFVPQLAFPSLRVLSVTHNQLAAHTLNVHTLLQMPHLVEARLWGNPGFSRGARWSSAVHSAAHWSLAGRATKVNAGDSSTECVIHSGDTTDGRFIEHGFTDNDEEDAGSLAPDGMEPYTAELLRAALFGAAQAQNGTAPLSSNRARTLQIHLRQPVADDGAPVGVHQLQHASAAPAAQHAAREPSCAPAPVRRSAVPSQPTVLETLTPHLSQTHSAPSLLVTGTPRNAETDRAAPSVAVQRDDSSTLDAAAPREPASPPRHTNFLRAAPGRRSQPTSPRVKQELKAATASPCGSASARNAIERGHAAAERRPDNVPLHDVRDVSQSADEEKTGSFASARIYNTAAVDGDADPRPMADGEGHQQLSVARPPAPHAVCLPAPRVEQSTVELQTAISDHVGAEVLAIERSAHAAASAQAAATARAAHVANAAAQRAAAVELSTSTSSAARIRRRLQRDLGTSNAAAQALAHARQRNTLASHASHGSLASHSTSLGDAATLDAWQSMHMSDSVHSPRIASRGEESLHSMLADMDRARPRGGTDGSPLLRRSSWLLQPSAEVRQPSDAPDAATSDAPPALDAADH
ncbi:MAG: hypothetical protein EOO41_00185, partial [Methanobacteriota archaeon]